MTQVAIVVNPPLSTPARPLQIVTLGSDLESLGKLDNEQTKRIRVYVTSILPNLSDASQTAITNCLKRPNSQPLSGSNSTVSSCLQDLNVPFNTQFQDFVLSTYQRQNSV